MKKIYNANLGTMYIDELDESKRPEKDRITVYDSDMEYLSYFSMDLLYENAESDEMTLEEKYEQIVQQLTDAKTINELIIQLGLDVEFFSDVYEMLHYLHDELNWDLPSKSYSPFENEYINIIGENYLLINER